MAQNLAILLIEDDEKEIDLAHEVLHRNQVHKFSYDIARNGDEISAALWTRTYGFIIADEMGSWQISEVVKEAKYLNPRVTFVALYGTVPADYVQIRPDYILPKMGEEGFFEGSSLKQVLEEEYHMKKI